MMSATMKVLRLKIVGGIMDCRVKPGNDVDSYAGARKSKNFFSRKL